MDHQVLRESYRNLAQYQGRDLPLDRAETFEKMKLERRWGNYYQDDHVQYREERRFRNVRGSDCPDQLQHTQRPKRVHRNSGLDMRLVFLHRSNPRSHSTSRSVGTGVFLPPGTGSTKSGCATVLLPAGVIQALQLHFDRTERNSRSHPQLWSIRGHFPPEHDAAVNNRNGYNSGQQKQRLQTAAALWNQDVEEDLPQDWTY